MRTRPPVRSTIQREGGLISEEEGRDHPLHRWLASRLAGQSGETSDPTPTKKSAAKQVAKPVKLPAPQTRPAEQARPEPRSNRGPEPARGSGPVALGSPGFRPIDVGSADDDLATETGDPATVLRQLREREADPATVQLARIPVAFIGESVMDPETVFDHRPEATRWREETQQIDELPPGPLPSFADRSAPTLSRGGGRLVPPLDEEDEEEAGGLAGEFDRNVILVGLLIGAVSGFVAVLVFVAWFAGRV